MDFNVFVVILGVFIVLLGGGGFFGVAWVPTKKNDYERIAKLINPKAGTVLYDLGSGDGSLVFYLSKKYNLKCVGIEISPLLYFYSKIKSMFYKNVKIKYGDFFKQEISEADTIYAFLHPKMYKKLKLKIKKDAKEGAAIVLALWPFKDENYVRSSTKEKSISYYLYENKRY